MNHDPAIVVLAAGAGSRYHGPQHKLSEMLGGERVLVRTLRNALASQMPVVLVVSERIAHEVAGLVPPRDLVVVDALSQRTWGMGDSIAAGVAMRASAGGWLVLPGDMPLVRPASLRAVAGALDQQPIAYAQHRGRRGHPVGFAAEMFSELVMLKGDEGARRLLARAAPQGVGIGGASEMRRRAAARSAAVSMSISTPGSSSSTGAVG